MRTLPCSPKTARPLLRGQWAAIAIACATLLGGCSIWPKALTFGSASEPVQAPEQTQAQTQTPPPAPAEPVAPPPPAASTATAAMPTALEPQTPVVTTPLAESAKVEPTPATPAATPKPAAKSAAKAPVHKPANKASALVPGYYINVGLFAVPTNGTKAYKKLEDAGLPVFSDGIKNKKGNLTRVRVGPFNTQAEADAAATQIRTLKLDAAVFKQ